VRIAFENRYHKFAENVSENGNVSSFTWK